MTRQAETAVDQALQALALAPAVAQETARAVAQEAARAVVRMVRKVAREVREAPSNRHVR